MLTVALRSRGHKEALAYVRVGVLFISKFENSPSPPAGHEEEGRVKNCPWQAGKKRGLQGQQGQQTRGLCRQALKN